MHPTSGKVVDWKNGCGYSALTLKKEKDRYFYNRSYTSNVYPTWTED